MVRSSEDYIPTYTLVEKVIRDFVGKKDYVHADFEGF